MIDKLKLLQVELFGEGMFNLEDRYSRVNINHIPIMITNGLIFFIFLFQSGFPAERILSKLI